MPNTWQNYARFPEPRDEADEIDNMDAIQHGADAIEDAVKDIDDGDYRDACVLAAARDIVRGGRDVEAEVRRLSAFMLRAAKQYREVNKIYSRA